MWCFFLSHYSQWEPDNYHVYWFPLNSRYLNKLLLNHVETTEQIAWLGSRRCAINIHFRLVCRTQTRKTNTCETKGDSRQNNPNICWVVNSVCPGERKLVGCCVALFLQRWIPARLTPTLHEHKTTLCDCWLLLGLITILLGRVKSKVRATDPLKQCWHCVWNKFN